AHPRSLAADAVDRLARALDEARVPALRGDGLLEVGERLLRAGAQLLEEVEGVLGDEEVLVREHELSEERRRLRPARADEVRGREATHDRVPRGGERLLELGEQARGVARELGEGESRREADVRVRVLGRLLERGLRARRAEVAERLDEDALHVPLR